VPLELTSTDCTEILGLDIYQRCDQTGERVNLAAVEVRLAELASHPDGHCGLCKAARRFSVTQVPG
jgi:hypothetical protein